MPGIVAVGNPQAGAAIAPGTIDNFLAVGRPVGLLAGNFNAKLLLVDSCA